MVTDNAATDTVIAPEPDGAPRLASLDILRGVAILGILFMNINDMGASMTASFGDVRHLGWTALDQAAWWLRQVFASGTARGMLEMLFGAGMVILTGRMADAAGDWSALRGYYGRNLVLFVFGLAHMAVLLWPGDILHTYAVAALLTFPLREARPRLLITIGLLFAGLQLVSGALGYADARQWIATYDVARVRQAQGAPITTEQAGALRRAAAREQRVAAEAREVVVEDAARTGTVATWARYQWHQALTIQQQGLELFFVLEAWSTMLIGAALFKLGWLQGGRSARWYGRAAIITYAAALLMRVVEADEGMVFALIPRIGDATAELSRLAMTLAHIFLINWLLVSGVGTRVLAPFRAAGQTALSLYVAQTIIGLWVLFPLWGLGLYGQWGWAALMAAAVAINAVLLVTANLWVRRFRIAPVEWAWRSIVAGRRLPFRRS